MLGLCLLTLCLLLPLTAVAQAPLFPMRAQGLWGYMDAKGHTVIAPQYLSAEDFRGDVALVQSEAGYMLIDHQGQPLLAQPEHLIASIDGRDDGLYSISDDQGREGYYDLKYGVYCPPRYAGLMLEFASDMIPFYENWLVGYVDRRTGEIAIEPRYEPNDNTLFFDDVFASGDIPKDGQTMGERIACDIIQGNGQILHLPEGIRIVGAFSRGLASFEDASLEAEIEASGERWRLGLITAEGQVVIPPKYLWIGSASEGLISVCNAQGLWGHVDMRGQTVLSPRYAGWFGDGAQYGYIFHHGMALFELTDGSAIAIDPMGNELFRLEKGSFDRLGGLMDNGLIWFEQGWRSGLLDSTGRLISPAVYQLPDEGPWYSDRFPQGRQAVALDGLWGYLDNGGQLVIPCQYDSAQNFRHGLARVEKDGRLAYIDLSGATVWQED